MRRILLRMELLVGLVVPLAACGDASLDPLPLRITIEVSSATAAPGDAVNFVVVAQGGNLLGVEVDYGDNSSDQYGAGGARTARVTFSHAFSVVGVYQVRATVTDAVAGQREAGVEIRIQ